MKKIAFIVALLLPALYMAASSTLPLDTTYRAGTSCPIDTTFRYLDRAVVISEKEDELNVSIYRVTERGDTVESYKMYEGIFTDNRSIERRYEGSFEISVPDIFKPKKQRRPSRSHWAGFGVGFTNLPVGFDFDGELSSIMNLSRSLQYNLNFIDGSWRLGDSNFSGITGMGIQFNAIHWQNNKAIEVEDYHSVITTAEPGSEYRRSRLHYTYLTFPLLIETNWNIGRGSHFFVNTGVVGKIKTASSSRIWWNNEDGKKQKTMFPGDLNIRPVTLDLIAQAGISDFGIFVSYTPFNLFRDNRGPKGNQATIGLQLYF
ncbi:MAG: hypothetical protein GX371_07265 [Bacteroidales bacterium]|nr:hypothetical protein [Bacteroidales bacterium]